MWCVFKCEIFEKAIVYTPYSWNANGKRFGRLSRSGVLWEVLAANLLQVARSFVACLRRCLVMWRWLGSPCCASHSIEYTFKSQTYKWIITVYWLRCALSIKMLSISFAPTECNLILISPALLLYIFNTIFSFRLPRFSPELCVCVCVNIFQNIFYNAVPLNLFIFCLDYVVIIVYRIFDAYR